MHLHIIIIKSVAVYVDTTNAGTIFLYKFLQADDTYIVYHSLYTHINCRYNYNSCIKTDTKK